MPGQEEGNGEWIESVGAGFVADDPNRLVALLGRLAADPTLTAQIAARAAALSQPEAADRIAAAILEIADQVRVAEPIGPAPEPIDSLERSQAEIDP
jgi:UDP-N-acetylglucosamine:LPS N-acetylglucosamine transferase